MHVFSIAVPSIRSKIPFGTSTCTTAIGCRRWPGIIYQRRLTGSNFFGTIRKYSGDSTGHSHNSRVALIMGVTNQRSIAWSCVRRFLLQDQDRHHRDDPRRRPWNVILTCQNDKIRTKVESMIESSLNNTAPGGVLGTCSVDVTDPTSMKYFFQEQLPEILRRQQQGHGFNGEDDEIHDSLSSATIDAVVHSIAFAPNLKKHSLLETTVEDFTIAHQVSSYSLIDVARNVLPYMSSSNTNNEDSTTTTRSSSITTLSYLGAECAIPGYNVMGPAKASLESVVRGLALELGPGGRHQHQKHDDDDDDATHHCPINPSAVVRVNAIRAGPISTISSKGGIANFQEMLRDVEDRSPLCRNVSADEVAATVYHVAAEATGITGQTINVDGGYSIVSGPPVVMSR
jgi:enoyl-[acyl-carrier protein] reductase I